MREVEQLVVEFRNAIERARKSGEQDDNNFFNRFPKGCCGETCDLLAQYLWNNKISVTYVSGTHYYGESSYDSQNHAWLLFEDNIIIDITGDQFKDQKMYYYYDKAIYVGSGNAFYELFDVDSRRDIHTYEPDRILDERQKELYEKIMRHIKPSLKEQIMLAQKKVVSSTATSESDEIRIKELNYPISRQSEKRGR